MEDTKTQDFSYTRTETKTVLMPHNISRLANIGIYTKAWREWMRKAEKNEL